MAVRSANFHYIQRSCKYSQSDVQAYVSAYVISGALECCHAPNHSFFAPVQSVIDKGVIYVAKSFRTLLRPFAKEFNFWSCRWKEIFLEDALLKPLSMVLWSKRAQRAASASAELICLPKQGIF